MKTFVVHTGAALRLPKKALLSSSSSTNKYYLLQDRDAISTRRMQLKADVECRLCVLGFEHAASRKPLLSRYGSLLYDRFVGRGRKLWNRDIRLR